ncbi:hypothetical protein T439DRAFT_324002 [Meredithblackwellia eburnea MCA 4105]
MSANSYSNLIRRSKLASYSPVVDQVYTAHGAHRSRSNFGFKRPLPQQSTSAAPFVRVSRLDNDQKRTKFRKATREALHLKKWNEANLFTTSFDKTGKDVADKIVYDAQVQSRFIDQGEQGAIFDPLNASEVLEIESGLSRNESSLETGSHEEGGGKEGEGAGSNASDEVRNKKAIQGARSIVNFLSMGEAEFSKLVSQLEGRRREFEDFLAENGRRPESLASYASNTPKATIYQDIELFLSSTTPIDHNSLPAPRPHRSLGLRYSQPSRLEAAFAPPIPGRILWPASTSDRKNGSTPSSGYGGKYITSLFGHLSGTLSRSNTNGVSQTTWFPDSKGVRSNTPGQGLFEAKARIDVTALSARLANAAQRGMKEFRGNGFPHEPEALASGFVDLSDVVVVTGGQHLPGTQAYSGEIPVSTRRDGLSKSISGILSDLTESTPSRRVPLSTQQKAQNHAGREELRGLRMGDSEKYFKRTQKTSRAAAQLLEDMLIKPSSR